MFRSQADWRGRQWLIGVCKLLPETLRTEAETETGPGRKEQKTRRKCTKSVQKKVINLSLLCAVNAPRTRSGTPTPATRLTRTCFILRGGINLLPFMSPRRSTCSSAGWTHGSVEPAEVGSPPGSIMSLCCDMSRL